MADKARTTPEAAPSRQPGKKQAGPDKQITNPDMAVDQNSRNQPFRPDPRTGEVPAGPGDAGLADRPEANAGSPGTKQMSYRRLGIGLGIAALLSVLTVIFMTIL